MGVSLRPADGGEYYWRIKPRDHTAGQPPSGGVMPSYADGSVLSTNDAQFIAKALKDSCRIDGRGLLDFRPIEYKFAEDDTGAEVAVGQTRVATVITAELVAPFGDRGNEGRVNYNVQLSPLAFPDPSQSGDLALVLTTFLEKVFRESGSVDQEALCVIAGRKVWSLRVDVQILQADGNVGDAAVLSTLAALLAFRRPAVTVGGNDGSQILVHSPAERETVALSIHHMPLSISFAFYEAGALYIIDPGRKEEVAQCGCLTVVVNAHGEVCAVSKPQGHPLTVASVSKCARVAASVAEGLTTQLRQAVAANVEARVASRVLRH